MKSKRTWVPLLFLVFFALNAIAQQPLAGSKLQADYNAAASSSIPNYVLYHQFFRHLLYLDNQASNLKADTGNSRKIRDYYQNKLRFSSDKFVIIKTIATSTEEQITYLDTRAKAIIKSFQASHKNVSTSKLLPPPPAELAQLQQQRNALIESQITQLKKELGFAATRLNGFLRAQFAPHIKIATVSASRAHNPAINPIPPFEKDSSR